VSLDDPSVEPKYLMDQATSYHKLQYKNCD
jgi:hypothetical protein